jgi:hypothetical protein
VAPLASAENTKVNKQYLANLTKYFGGAA